MHHFISLLQIATTWRSGSTFLGDILLSHPATFYHYEPLINYQIHQIRDGFLASKAVQVIESIFNCDYSNLGKQSQCLKTNHSDFILPFVGNFFDYARRHLEALSHNERLWSHCYGLNRQHCYNQEFLSQFCSLLPCVSRDFVYSSQKVTSCQHCYNQEFLSQFSFLCFVIALFIGYNENPFHND